METDRKYIGRCAMPIKLTLAALVCAPWVVAVGLPPHGVGIGEAVNEGSSAWSQTLLADDEVWLPLDEQIFSAISPIVDLPESVKLPEDQQTDD
jgi:hypothetical protein